MLEAFQIVGPFYSFWCDFSTLRSFAWLDKWNLRDAPNRPTARAMEKENKKLRETGKKARNEEIRVTLTLPLIDSTGLPLRTW